MPCLQQECIDKLPEDQQPKKNIEDYCSVCYCSGLGQEPSVILKCGHIFHMECLKQQVQKQYNGPRIVFGYLDCPDCKTRISAPQCPSLEKEVKK